eukprot:5577819-Prymnesium_polylepis.3
MSCWLVASSRDDERRSRGPQHQARPQVEPPAARSWCRALPWGSRCRLRAVMAAASCRLGASASSVRAKKAERTTSVFERRPPPPTPMLDHLKHAIRRRRRPTQHVRADVVEPSRRCALDSAR